MIVFYDGDCGFCNRSIKFVLKHQRNNQDFQFASLQSTYCKQEFEKRNYPKPDLSTLYVLENDVLLDKSNAGLTIVKKLRGLYPALLVLKIIPRFIRDKVYDFIAKRRHRISSGFCYIPNETERLQFKN